MRDKSSIQPQNYILRVNGRKIILSFSLSSMQRDTHATRSGSLNKQTAANAFCFIQALKSEKIE